jgi:4-amino-4-deoxy-L-arabinose transferase-like glycosyltransferase
MAVGVVASLVAVKLIAHFATNAFGPYEFHRDAFLYLAMGEHLQLWNMDFPPFIAMLAQVTRFVLGDSLFALRLPSALISSALVVVAALTAREFGGRRMAQGLAALSVVASALFMRTGNLFQPVAIDQLWWTLALFCLVKLCRTNDHRWWIGYGIATGFGLLTKFSVLVLGFATLLALVVTPSRVWLKTRWPWLAAGIAFFIGSPSIVGQIALEFPIFVYMSDLSSAQLSRQSPIGFVVEQPMMMGGFILAVIGAGAMAIHREWRQFRFVAWTTILTFALFVVLRGKSYYVGPLYPVLFGMGAAVLDRMRIRRWRLGAQWSMAGLMVVYTAVLFPLGLPVLPPETLERYLVAIGMQEAANTTNVGNQERIPQDFADMLNGEEQVAEVARVYHALPDADRERAVILASNYGEAGAIDFYGPRYDVPKAIAFVGTYWLFGPGDLPGDVVILHGFREGDWEDYCESTEAAGFVTHPFAVAEQRDLTIYVCRNPRLTLQELWPQVEGET